MEYNEYEKIITKVKVRTKIGKFEDDYTVSVLIRTKGMVPAEHMVRKVVVRALGEITPDYIRFAAKYILAKLCEKFWVDCETVYVSVRITPQRGGPIFEVERRVEQ